MFIRQSFVDKTQYNLTSKYKKKFIITLNIQNFGIKLAI